MDLNKYKVNAGKIKHIQDYWQNNPCNEWFFGPGINCRDVNKIDLEQDEMSEVEDDSDFSGDFSD